MQEDAGGCESVAASLLHRESTEGEQPHRGTPLPSAREAARLLAVSRQRSTGSAPRASSRTRESRTRFGSCRRTWRPSSSGGAPGCPGLAERMTLELSAATCKSATTRHWRAAPPTERHAFHGQQWRKPWLALPGAGDLHDGGVRPVVRAPPRAQGSRTHPGASRSSGTRQSWGQHPGVRGRPGDADGLRSRLTRALRAAGTRDGRPARRAREGDPGEEHRAGEEARTAGV